MAVVERWPLVEVRLFTQERVGITVKIPKISPSKYKPPKPVTQNHPSKYKPPPGVCTWKIALKYKGKQNKNGKFIPNTKLAQSILKRRFLSVDKPLQKYAPQKGPLKYISPRGLFAEFYGILDFPADF